MSYVVACADVGSVRRGKFQWASSLRGEGNSGGSPSSLAGFVAARLLEKKKVALGFECPLSVPIPSDEMRLGAGRVGEGNRPWSAGAGAGALATGLVQVTWVLTEVLKLVGAASNGISLPMAVGEFERIPGPALFVWEAFVTANAKGENDREDAEIGVEAYIAARSRRAESSVNCAGFPLSLASVALAHSGWVTDFNLLNREVYVVRAAV